MKVKLLREARIKHGAGEIVEVSTAERDFLISTGSAVAVDEAVKSTKDATPAKPKKTARTTKK